MNKEVKAATAKLKHLIGRWKETRLARAMMQYNVANGALLCGGITYKAIFSLFAGLALGFTVLVRILGNNQELKTQAIDSINNAVPGLIATDTTDGMLPMDALVLSTGVNITSVIAVLVLLWSVISTMEALRSSVRAMFSLPPAGSNPLSGKIRALGAFVGVALGVLIASAVGIASNTLFRFLNEWIDLGGIATVFVQIASIAVTMAFDGVVFILIVRLLGAVRPPRRDMIMGAAVVAVGFAVIRYLGTSVVVGSAAKNPIFATGAVLITVLVWLYMCARILLTACAVTANPPLTMLEHRTDEQFAKAIVQRYRVEDAIGTSGVHGGVQQFVEAPTPSPASKFRVVLVVAASVSIGFLTGRRRRSHQR